MPQDAKIGCVTLSAARTALVVCRRRRPPCLCRHLFHFCACSFLVLALVTPASGQCSSADASSMTSLFLSAGGHTVLSTEDSWPPRLTDTDQHDCAGESAMTSHHPAGEPLGPGLAEDSSSAAPGWGGGEQHTSRTCPKGCELSACPLG